MLHDARLTTQRHAHGTHTMHIPHSSTRHASHFTPYTLHLATLTLTLNNYAKNLILFLLLLSLQIQAQQDNAPVVGVSDKRVEVYGLKNARVVVDYQTTLENTDILISNGRIEAIGTNLSISERYNCIDLTGKTVYPSFVDAYAGNYGIKTSDSGSRCQIHMLLL